MKKYIKPTIKVRELATESSILAASFEAKGNLWEEDVTTTPEEITDQGAILGKKKLFDDSWDEE